MNISIELITLIMFGGLILTMMLGVPIAWSMGGITVIISILVMGANSLPGLVFTTFGVMWSISWITIPLFVYMGILLEQSGIADALFEALHKWSSGLNGGLAIGTVIICAIFAAMSGVSAAACVTMGYIAIPAMINRGYDKRLAVGSVLGPSTLGILIPPSVVMIPLAVIGQVSLGKLMMAGIIPGAIMATMFIGYIVIKGIIQPHTCPAIKENVSLREKLYSTKALILPIFIILSVLGTIFLGIATPTEAAATGVLATIISAAVNKRLNWKVIKKSTYDTFKVSGMIMWIVFAGVCFGSVYISLGGMTFIHRILMSVQSPWAVMILIMFILFILGMFIDPYAMIFIVAPITFPVVKDLGFNPIWYGILFVVSTQLAYITPPFGVNLFYIKGVSPQGVTSGDIYRSITPFLLVMIGSLILFMIFPELVLWLPNTVSTVK